MLKTHNIFLDFRVNEEHYEKTKKELQDHIKQENERLKKLYPNESLLNKDFIVIEKSQPSKVMKLEEAYLLDRKISLDGNLKDMYEFLSQLDMLSQLSYAQFKEQYQDFCDDCSTYVLFGDYPNKPPSNPGDLIADCNYFVWIKI